MYNKERYQSSPIEYVVYVMRIKGKNIFKIGQTNRLKHRLRNLLQGIYEPCHIFCTITTSSNVHARMVEKSLHGVMEEYRLMREWYHCPPDELIDEVKSFGALYNVHLFEETPDEVQS